ncbi:phage tail protein [Salmonella enterica subsp. houtenae]|nr:phage tail protein [Salmonella enterica subsp. houtenae]EEE2293890.1 phage tail protein [Salmonella enterica subsp. houtenae]EJI9870978.1 gpW family protein [Salmonella enterica]EKT2303843.1 gpW family protein [Salmonella enterica]SUF50786.1 head-tail joining protein [Salmonella enterica]
MMYTQEMLTEARQALHELLLGKRVVSVSKNGRQVQFTLINIADLRNYIAEIESGLGLPSRRRGPAGVRL